MTAAIKAQDKLYYKSGVWKCEKSPTGAHESHETDTVGTTSIYQCIHCGYIHFKENLFEKGSNDLGKL